jgi:hypothetical protein
MENLDLTSGFANFVRTSESAITVWVEIEARRELIRPEEDMRGDGKKRILSHLY